MKTERQAAQGGAMPTHRRGSARCAERPALGTFRHGPWRAAFMIGQTASGAVSAVELLLADRWG